MRILLLAQWYDPIIGGEETHVRSLAQSLARRGHRVTVAALAHPDRPSEHWDGDVRVHRVRATVQRLPLLFADEARQSAPPLPDPGIASALRRLVERERPDVVHAHNWMVHSYVPVRERLTPLILTLHDYGLVCAKKVLLYRGRECSGPAPAKCLRCTAAHYGSIKGPVTLGGMWARHAALRRAVDGFIAVSQAVAEKNDLAKLGTRYDVIPNFIPDEFSTTAGEAPPQLPDEPFILFVGSLSRIKGVEPLLEAYAALTEASRPPLVLMGYTGSETLDALQHLPRGATIITDQPRSAIAAAWQKSIFGVVPSICPESFGLVALEAMVFGRPVIASRIGGLQEVVIDDETGLLVEPGSSSALRDAIARLTTDTDLRGRLGREARKRSSRFAASVVVPRIEQLYGDLMRVRGSRS